MQITSLSVIPGIQKNKQIMKKLLFILAVCCFVSNSFSQSNKTKIISTVGILDTNETKSGYRINEYYIELTEKQLDSLKGKKIEVRGKLMIIKGIDPNAKEIVQGSPDDRYFILEPEFRIIYDSKEPLIQDDGF